MALTQIFVILVSTHHIQCLLFVVVLFFGTGIEGDMDARLRLPTAVQIVSHQIDPVQKSGQLGDVIPRDVRGRGRGKVERAEMGWKSY